MKTATGRQTSYALGDSQQELGRLARQAEVFNPFTRQLFQEAGIAAGMRVLDVGSGAGDVSFLSAEMVGPSGEVVGADSSAAAVDYAECRASKHGLRNVSFVIGDPTLMQFEDKFDAVVGRFVLMYYSEPLAAIKKLASHVCTGGTIAFQEFDMSTMRSFPPAPTFDKAANLLRQVFSASGARTNIGVELNSIFVDAGLPEPVMRMDAVIGSHSRFPYELVASTLHSLLPTIERLRLWTPEIEMDVLEARMREEAMADKGVAISPALIGAWSQKP